MGSVTIGSGREGDKRCRFEALAVSGGGAVNVDVKVDRALLALPCARLRRFFVVPCRFAWLMLESTRRVCASLESPLGP